MLEMLAGTLGFWAMLAGSSIAIVAFVENGRGFLATLTAAGAITMLAAANGWGAAIMANPALAAIALGGYVALGTAYAVLKWWSWVRAQRAELVRRIAEQLVARNAESIEQLAAKRDVYGKELNLEHFWKDVEGRTGYGTTKVSRRAPQASAHKARILTWMTYWPWSAAWTLLNDPVRRAFVKAYGLVAGQLQRIADRAWEGVPQ